ncbi:hypothetical protein QN362_10840 [Actimicrobium sp. CCC2.4]|uniref:hypothetical protein n=1 Tax=Actimicrobium sp. CCC2.4 TaxID=3048606 RepID=UPI002AC8C902|nr:hypothetical protein [Actimicrobium sp. CCC2.4]MEB0135824.1 hypothetical protein [Actimicrobium sp. CCC2.4]WPX33303.1 hypothetical protein RHM62_05545 [Actimicrobium sp. CCC2.4]
MSHNDADSGIPLLTEVLPLEQERMHDADLLAPPLLLLEASVPVLSSTAAQEPHWSEQDLARLEAEISDRITRQVLTRIDRVLEQRVRDSLADVLQVAVGGLAQEIRDGLQQTIEELIRRAVSQEVSRLKTTNN